MVTPKDPGQRGTNGASPSARGADAASARRAARREADEREELRIGFRLMGLAWAMVTEVLAGMGLGWIADHFAGTWPRWTTVGAIVGIVVAMYSLIRGGLSMNAYLERRGKGFEREAKQRKGGRSE